MKPRQGAVAGGVHARPMTNTTNPVTWFEIATANPAAATTFYGQLFGWAFSADEGGPEYQIISPGGDGIQGGLAATNGDRPTYATFFVQVADVAATCARAETLGGKVLVPATEAPGGQVVFAQLLDTDGNQIGIWRPSAGS
jgi:predicted enzyme related to lactoylglutathione lyase